MVTTGEYLMQSDCKEQAQNIMWEFGASAPNQT